MKNKMTLIKDHIFVDNVHIFKFVKKINDDIEFAILAEFPINDLPEKHFLHLLLYYIESNIFNKYTEYKNDLNTSIVIDNDIFIINDYAMYIPKYRYECITILHYILYTIYIS
jgi:hypothetical protein